MEQFKNFGDPDLLTGITIYNENMANLLSNDAIFNCSINLLQQYGFTFRVPMDIYLLCLDRAKLPHYTKHINYKFAQPLIDVFCHFLSNFH